MSEPITLYSFADFDRSARVRWLLNELGIPFQEQRLDPSKGEHQADEYLKLHPFARIPALQYHGRCLIESGAICTFLADAHPASGLAPAIDSAERADYLQWMFFACSSLEDAVVPVIRGKVFKSLPAETLAEAEQKLHGLLAKVDAELAGRPYAVGGQFTAADITLAHTLSLAARLVSMDAYPALKGYLANLAERPAAKAARVFTSSFPQ